MKRVNLFVLSTGFFIGLQSASAAESLYVLKGAQLTKFGVEATGAKQLTLAADWNLKWQNTTTGYICAEMFAHDFSDRCRIQVTQTNALRINEFSQERSNTTFEISYKWGDTVTNKMIDAMKEQATPSTDHEDLNDPTDVRLQTVYSRDGSCYAKELRFFVDDATKVISSLWFVDIAAHCP